MEYAIKVKIKPGYFLMETTTIEVVEAKTAKEALAKFTEENKELIDRVLLFEILEIKKI